MLLSEADGELKLISAYEPTAQLTALAKIVGSPAVWLMEEGVYIAFELVQSRFRNETFETVESAKAQQKPLIPTNAEY